MFIPYNSDAPLYHYPIATVGLIVVNIALYGFWPPYDAYEGRLEYVQQYFAVRDKQPEQMSDEEFDEVLGQAKSDMPDELMYPDWRMLQYGNGIRPWQWVTANFMHADWMHVLGNMIFLWGLGLVVEGKLGWWRFLAVYLLIGTAGYGLVQFIMLWGHGNALGASLPIYGIMVLALLWAPFNELNCVMWWGVRPIFMEVKIFYFSAGYLLMQVGFFLFFRMSMSSEALHLIGAFIAAPIGIIMLKKNMVDCEDWDIFSVWQGRNELTREERHKLDESKPEFQSQLASKQEAAAGVIQQIIKEGTDPAAAWALHLKMQHRFENWSLPETCYRGIIRLYQQQGKKAEALPVAIDYLRKFPLERTIDVRMILAQHMIRDADRPRQGLRVLAPLEPSALNDSQRQAYDKLLALAERKKLEIDLEEATEDW